MSGAERHASLIGATIGNYRVVAKLGEGGMGSVYLAEHPLIGKKVALKVLHDEYSANNDVVSRFFNEARAVNDIGHPNIVDIIDYGVVQTQTGPGFVYFIMEFLGGESLGTLIQREAPLAPERAFNVAAQVADALAASHQKGIIHRDLKPDNIFLLQRGRERDFVKVLDFGIAKLTGDGPGSRRTRTGIVMGTPAYMSPEQCEGKGNIDHRTDVYALGVVLYEMLTGRVPFAGEGYGEVLVQHLTMLPARPATVVPTIPAYAEAVVLKALQKKRDDRFQNMEEMIAALRDPNAFMAAGGGQVLAQAQGGTLTAGVAPMVPGSTVTPYPPGVPAVARPTTLSGGAAELRPAGARSRGTTIAISAGLALLVLGGVAVAFLRGGGGGDDDKHAAASEKAPPADPAPKPEPPVPDPSVKPPVVTPVPEAQKTIRLNVVSVPDGAEIWVDGEQRGKTPAEIELPRREGKAEVVLKLAGYKDEKSAVDMSRDATIQLKLDRDRHGGGKRPPRPRKPGEDDVLAPSFD